MITIGQLWRYPVKSMQGEPVDEVSFGPAGAVGDRAYGFVDVATERLVSAKHPHRYAAMLDCYASFVKAPQPGEPTPAVRVTFPDGESIEGDNEAIARRVSDLLGREVRMVNGASPGLAYEEIWPEMEGFGPDEFYGLLHVDPSHDDTSGERILRIPAGSAARGTLLDFASLHIVAAPSLAALAELHPGGEWDSRRLRPNIVFDVETPSGAASAPSGIEDQWIGRELVAESGARLAVIAHTPRCVMTTLSQPGLARDPKILQTMARSNRRPMGSLGLFAAAGAYAEVVTPGLARIGDTVELAGDKLATSSDLAMVLAQIEKRMTAGRTGQ